jgi:hypothetical protein
MSSSGERIREQLGFLEAERVVPTGSMWPVIRVGEVIRFRRSGRRPSLGEVWVAEVGGRHVVHRVLWVSGEGAALLKGDFAPRFDGWVERGRLFGPVSAVRRSSVWKPIDRRRDRIFGLLWSGLAWGYLSVRGYAGRWVAQVG